MKRIFSDIQRPIVTVFKKLPVYQLYFLVCWTEETIDQTFTASMIGQPIIININGIAAMEIIIWMMPIFTSPPITVPKPGKIRILIIKPAIARPRCDEGFCCSCTFVSIFSAFVVFVVFVVFFGIATEILLNYLN